MAKPTIQGVLLDVDGTLVQSNDAHTHAWVEAYAAFGYTVAFAQVRRLIGMGGDRLMPTVTPDLQADEGVGKQIADRRKTIFLEQYAPSLQPTPGARELVEALQQRGLRTVISSSAKRDELDTLLRAAHVDDLLHEATTQDDVEQSKPAPDAVQVAVKKISLPPDACVMLGDTPYDVESAQRAGVVAIAVRCGGWDDAALAGAHAIYDDPADLLAHLAQSPLATG